MPVPGDCQRHCVQSHTLFNSVATRYIKQIKNLIISAFKNAADSNFETLSTPLQSSCQAHKEAAVQNRAECLSYPHAVSQTSHHSLQSSFPSYPCLSWHEEPFCTKRTRHTLLFTRLIMVKVRSRTLNLYFQGWGLIQLLDI